MGDLFTIPTPMATGAFTSSSIVDLKMWLKSHRDKESITVSNNPEKGDFTNIQDAINSLPEDGGSILLKNGVYTIDEGLIFNKKSILLFGQTKEKSIIQWVSSGTIDGRMLYNGSTSESIVIENITFDGNDRESGIYYFTKNPLYFEQIIFKNCLFQDFDSNSFSYFSYLSHYKNLQILDCTFSGVVFPEKGLYFIGGTSTEKTTIDGNVFDCSVGATPSTHRTIDIYTEYPFYGTVSVFNNLFNDVCQFAIICTGDKNFIRNNKLFLTDTKFTSGSNASVISVSGSSIIEGNTFISTTVSTGLGIGTIISANSDSTIQNNTFDLLIGDYTTRIIAIKYRCSVSGNTVSIEKSGTTNSLTSIDVANSYSNVSGGNVFRINNNVNTYGATLDSSTYGCLVTSNVFSGFGTAINDLGSSNTTTPNKII